jgi:hypothetical protein
LKHSRSLRRDCALARRAGSPSGAIACYTLRQAGQAWYPSSLSAPPPSVSQGRAQPRTWQPGADRHPQPLTQQGQP